MLFNIWVTRKCNFVCSYCYEGLVKKNMSINRKMSIDIIKFIRKKMNNKNDTIIVNFHGGEPLLEYKEVKFLIENLKAEYANNIRFGITTNGYLLDDEKIDFLTKYCDYSMSISLDGGKEINDLNRKHLYNIETYDVILENAKKLISKNINTRCRMTVTSNNVGYLFDSVKEMYKLGFRVIIPVVDYYDSNWDKSKLNSLKSEYINIVNFFDKDLRNGKITIGFISDYAKRLKNGVCNPNDCTINIDSNGDLYPCAVVVGTKEYLIGNIFEGTNSQKVNKILQESSKVVYECKGCSNYDYCKVTRCKIINKLETGQYDKPSPIHCFVENMLHAIY